MTALVAINYDPAAQVTQATSALLPMTAIDTTHLRGTFTAPSSGIVFVRLRAGVTGATTFPRILLGILESSTVVARFSPVGGRAQSLATSILMQEVCGAISGIGAGSHTWDAAYGVEVVIAATNIVYGGPDDAAGADASGGFIFEVWPADNALAAITYDPAAAVTKPTTVLRAMTAMDTTFLRSTVTVPASGQVLWRIRTQFHGSATMGQALLGVMEGATVLARVAPLQSPTDTFGATSCVPLEASGIIITTPGSHTFDVASAVQTVSAAGGIKMGGPNDSTTNNAFGATIFELWPG